MNFPALGSSSIMAAPIIPEKYKDIVSERSLLRPGPPALFRLTPKTEKFGTVTRVTVGEKDLTKTNKTILLVGETGAGKSSLINSLVNYTMGVTFEDNIWFEIVKEEDKSQTSDVIVYQIFGFEAQTLPYSLTIIDTPGFNNTRGIGHDLIISQRLLDWFRSDDGVHEINAVGLVLKASDNRLSDQLRYVLDSVVSLFGKDMEQNIVTLITHSDGMPPTNALKALEAAKVKHAKNEKNDLVHFLFNNSQSTEKTEETELGLENAWRVTKRGMGQFTALVEKSSPQILQATFEVRNVHVHNKTVAYIQNLQERIILNELKQTELKQTQEAVKKSKDQWMKKEKDFTVEVDEVYRDREPIDDGRWALLFFKEATICTVCEENCHYPGCTEAPSREDCDVMENGCCTVCTRKCPVSDHVKGNYRYVTKTRKVKKNKKEVKEKHKKNKAESESSLKLLETLEKEMRDLITEKNQLLEEAYRHIVSLEQVVLKVYSLFTHVLLDFLIERLKEKGDREKVQRLEGMRSQVDEPTAAGKAAKEATEISNASEKKYKGIVSKDPEISLGFPIVCPLTTKTEKFGTLTRMTVGIKDPTKTNKTILLVGETGAGKSSLVNSLVNYTTGVEFEGNMWFDIVKEKDKKEQTESQTLDVIVYQIFGFEGKILPFSLTIIDTPGYGSTSGIEHDLNISQRLLDWFRSDDGVHEISAVGLVLKASDNRLSDRLRYVFDSVVSLFGKDMEQNVVALITHSDGITPTNALQALEAANVQCARDEKNQPVHFLFNNSQNTERTEKNRAALKFSWDFTNDEMGQFTDFLERAASKKLMTTVEVLKARIRITACINNLQERIILIEDKQKVIQHNEEVLKKHEQEMKMNEEFTVEVDEVCKERKDITGGKWWLVFYEGAVCCTVCEENCHYPGCTVARSPNWCEVMKKGRCTSCTNKCPVSDHVKKQWRYVTKTRKVKKTEKEMKERYEKNKAESEKKLSLLENLREEMENLKTKKNQLLEEAYQLVVSLEQIALNVCSLSTHVHLDFLIEKMKEKGDEEKVQSLWGMRSRMDEGTRAGLGYMWGQLRALGK